MRTIAAFLRLSPADRRLVLRCWCLLVSAMVGVRVRSLKPLLGAIDARTARHAARDGSGDAALRFCASAARRVWPRPTCLVTALAGYELMNERGDRVTLVIGGHTTDRAFKGHAWLERDGVVVLGAPIEAYQPIWCWSPGTTGASNADAAVEKLTVYQ
jgi:transglutaminase superfamily protein